MPNQLRAGDTDEHVVDQRAENQSKRAKIDKFLERYGRLLLTIAIAISTWFLSHVVAPLNQIPHVVAITDTLAHKQASTDAKFNEIKAKLDEAHEDRTRMVDILAALAGLQCDQFTSRERRTSKLCGKLLNGELP